MKFKPVYNISQKSETEADMLIYGVIGDSWFEDGNPAKQVVSDFKNLEKKYARINVRINSPGGSVWDGLPIFNAIKSSKADVHTYVDGIAYSMGAMIALAGKTVHAAKGSLILLHNVSGFAIGNANDLRTTAKEMDTYDEVLTQLIADKSGRSVDDVKKDWMNYQDNLMSATAAHAAKLVDVVESYDAKDVPENVEKMSIKDVISFYTPDASPQPSPGGEGDPTPTLPGREGGKPQQTTTNPIENNPVTPKPMFDGKLKALKALKGVAATAITAEMLDSINQELVAFGIEGVTIVLDSEVEALSNVEDKINGLNATITAKDAVITGHVTKIGELEAKIGAGPAAAATAPAAQIAAEQIAQTGGKPSFERTSVDDEVEKMKAEYAAEVS